MLELLDQQAESADVLTDWPLPSMALLREIGAFRWSIPCEWGGEGITGRPLFDRHEEIARRCLTTAFILSQREASIRQLLKGPRPVVERFLPSALRGEAFSTVGLSHLTTSRQHQAPVVTARKEPGGYRLAGEIPWVTGADQASFLTVGATLEDGSQMMLVLPADRAGVRAANPMPLAALRGSRTSSVVLDDVWVEEELVLSEPSPRVLGPIGGGGLETSNLGIGLAHAAGAFIAEQADRRPALAPVAEQIAQSLDLLRVRIARASDSPAADEVYAIRVEASRWALQATQVALLMAKGTGFLSPHPAQRWARQALFFLVWSCPGPVTDGLLASLLPSSSVDEWT